MRRAVSAAALAVGLLAAGCGSSSGGSHPAAVGPDYGDTGPTHATLLRVADLDPCPVSSGAHGGLPDLTLPCLGHGPAVRLSGLRGRPTVVNVWGSWCGPCQEETPYLSSVYDSLRGRVRFLGVDVVDSDDSALSFAAHVSPPMRYPSVVDHDRETLLKLKLPPSPPVTVFVSSTGQVLHVAHGAYRSAAALRADITSYLHIGG